MKTIQVRYASVVDKNKSLYDDDDHTKFNEAIEVVIKMLDRLDRFDRVFAHFNSFTEERQVKDILNKIGRETQPDLTQKHPLIHQRPELTDNQSERPAAR